MAMPGWAAGHVKMMQPIGFTPVMQTKTDPGRRSRLPTSAQEGSRKDIDI
mgnify:CR=1 FL=1